MGDRGNIKLIYGEQYSPLYLYSHWGGSELPTILQNALIRGRGRWGDDPYLARIIFSEMIQDEVLQETGYGMSPYECDNEHPIIVVDLPNNTVEIEGILKYTFDEFVSTASDNFQDF